MAVRARVPARITFEAAFLALLGIAFPVLFGIAIVVAGVAVILVVGHFVLFLAKLVWILVFPLFGALRALWSGRGARQDGEPLDAEQAPSSSRRSSACVPRPTRAASTACISTAT